MSRTLFKFLVNSGFFIVFFVSCEPGNRVDLSEQRIETRFQRFDRAFFETDTQNFQQELARLKKDFAPFFMNNGTRQFWLNQRQEKLQIDLYHKAQSRFGDMEEQNLALNLALKRYYHYFGTNDTLQFYTYISRLDFDFPVLFADSICFVGLDMYLGENSRYYNHLARYLAYYRQPKFVVRDAVMAVVQSRLERKEEGETLLDAMVYFGKKHYVLHRLLPELSEADLLKYPQEKLDFARRREKVMWVYFIENQLLYRTGQDLKRNFIDEAPFSKFRTEMDSDTPGRIGQWYGFKIVEAYMRNNGNTRLEDLLAQKDSQKILQHSGYKP